MKPFLEAVRQFTRQMENEHGFEQVHMFDPNGPTTADVLRSLDPRSPADGHIVPPQTWRIIGDSHQGEPESYIPFASPGHAEIMRRLAEGPTPEDRKRWGREAARQEAERRQALGHSIARHVALFDEYRDHRVVSALLEAHGPHTIEVGGKQYAECHGCPTYWEDDPYGESGEVHHEWPCPTWTTIAEQTERAS
jgi:hypothetical protein